MKRSQIKRRPVSLLEGLENRKLFAVNYTIVDLAPDTGGITHTGEAYGISDNGKIAGQYDGKAAWWSADGTVPDLGFVGYATDINDNGVVCGVDRTGGISQPFVWNGSKTILSLDGNTNGVAAAINDAGTVVGSFFQTGIERKSFRAPLGGSAVNIGAPAGFEFVDATGINDNGQISGEVYSTDAGYKAFIKSGSTFKLLGPLPGGSTTHAGHGIKNNGDIAIWGPSADFYSDGTTKVYNAYVVTGNGYGPIIDRGTYNNSFYDIDASDINSYDVITGNNNPGLFDEQGMINRGGGFDLVQNQISAAAGWTRIFSANAVNDSGRVVGEGLNSLDQRSPYVLIPLPSSTHSISGVLWNDSDADGFKDAGESTSGVRTVYIDANANGKLDSGETSTTSNSSGQYTFSGLADGTYKISRVFPDGYGLSNGTGGASWVNVNLNGANVTNLNLGSRTVSAAKGSISGVLWNDSDADGIFDGSESASGVRQVFIDTNGNKKLDAGELSTYSDSTGKYKFSNLNAGTYKVTRVFPSGYKLSNNSLGYVTVSLASGQNKTGVNLGSRTA
jgi:hypothetical protein